MSADLKPCPFCGSPAELLHTKAWDYFVRCTDKGCAARTRQHHENDVGAVDAWNTRTERTCRFIDDSDGEFPPKCSACGYEPSIYECSWLGDGGYEYEGNYCPECGAKVVDE